MLRGERRRLSDERHDERHGANLASLHYATAWPPSYICWPSSRVLAIFAGPDREDAGERREGRARSHRCMDRCTTLILCV
jgi:hypothetical protein